MGDQGGMSFSSFQRHLHHRSAGPANTTQAQPSPMITSRTRTRRFTKAERMGMEKALMAPQFVQEMPEGGRLAVSGGWSTEKEERRKLKAAQEEERNKHKDLEVVAEVAAFSLKSAAGSAAVSTKSAFAGSTGLAAVGAHTSSALLGTIGGLTVGGIVAVAAAVGGAALSKHNWQFKKNSHRAVQRIRRVGSGRRT